MSCESSSSYLNYPHPCQKTVRLLLLRKVSLALRGYATNTRDEMRCQRADIILDLWCVRRARFSDQQLPSGCVKCATSHDLWRYANGWLHAFSYAPATHEFWTRQLGVCTPAVLSTASSSWCQAKHGVGGVTGHGCQMDCCVGPLSMEALSCTRIMCPQDPGYRG